MKKIILIFSIILCVVLCGGVVAKLFVKTETPPETPEIVENVDYSKLVYTALGDSITWGQDGITNTRMTTPYCDVVGQTLGLKKVYNLGIGNSAVSKMSTCDCHDNFDTAHTPMCERYTNISIYSDIISIFGGVNDRGLSVPLGDINSYDKSTFYGAYNTLIKGVKTNYSSAWVFLITPTSSRKTQADDWTNNIGLTRYDYVNAVLQLGEKWNLPVLELHDNKDINNELLDYTTDGVHPSQNTHTNIIAPIISQFIKDNYKK